MKYLLPTAAILVTMALLSSAAQRRRPKLGQGQGIVECDKGGRLLNYGYGELLEAGVYEKDGTTLVPRKTQLGVDGLQFKVDQEYIVKAKFIVKPYSPFGSYPKFMGIKLTENFTDADPNTKKAYKAIFRENLIGVHHCSESLRGALGKDSDGCKWLTQDYKETCPFSNDDDTEAEIEFKFIVPKLPDAVSETKFRLIGTQERVDGNNGCERLLNPSFPDPIETTSDKNMICFKYNSVFTRR